MKETSSVVSENHILSAEPSFINSLIHLAVAQKRPFALWKKPQLEFLFFAADFQEKPSDVKTTIEDRQGFIFSPFNQSDQKESFFIQSDLLINLTNNTYHHHPITQKLSETFLNEALSVNMLSNFPTVSLLPSSLQKPESGSELFKKNVEKAIELIKSGELKKVVLARAKEHPLAENFNFAEAFKELCKDKNSFVSLVSIPGEGIWMGGSPELLVCIDQNQHFKTVALAGTQAIKEGQDISSAVWTQKEIEEQALVCRYIISCFKSIRLREYEEDGPRTVVAGNLMHLKTNFKVNMKEVNAPDLGSVMLELLHPTSAVCGMPKDQALDFIQHHEKLDRKFYSGFLGPVNIDQETHIFVNIRCAEFRKGFAYTYSGAGITQESDPVKEFHETELKMRVMEEIILNQ